MGANPRKAFGWHGGKTKRCDEKVKKITATFSLKGAKTNVLGGTSPSNIY